MGAALHVGLTCPIVGQEYQLSQVADACVCIAEGKGARGKLVLIV